jgi:O-antigen/teichoic acid export membrane protein
MLLPEFKTIKLPFDRALWSKMMVYAAPLIIVGFAGMVNEMLSRTMMKYLLTGTPEENMAQLGIFGANYKLAMLITLFTQAYRYAAEPFFFRHANDDNAKQTQSEVTKWFTIAAAVGMLAILLFLDIVKYFLGKGFHSGIGVVPILLVANLLLGVYYNFSVWFRLKDRTGLGAWISLAGAAITIVLNILWIPLYGYTGAAWVTLICYLFMSWATWVTGQKHYPVPYQLGRMMLYTVSALGLWAAAEWLCPFLPASIQWSVRLLLFAGYLVMVWWLELRKRH